MDPSKNSRVLQHSMLSRPELTLQISQCGPQSVPPNLVLHSSVGQIRIHKVLSFAWPAVSLLQQNPTCLGPSMNVSNKQICTLLRQSHSESDPVFRLTPFCLVVSVMVYSLSRFWCCILIQMMMSGSSFKSDSIYKYCLVQSTPTLNPQLDDTKIVQV